MKINQTIYYGFHYLNDEENSARIKIFKTEEALDKWIAKDEANRDCAIITRTK